MQRRFKDSTRLTLFLVKKKKEEVEYQNTKKVEKVYRCVRHKE